MAIHSSILAFKCHGLRNLVGYGPGVIKEFETTEQLNTQTKSKRSLPKFDNLEVFTIFQILPPAPQISSFIFR